MELDIQHAPPYRAEVTVRNIVEYDTFFSSCKMNHGLAHLHIIQLCNLCELILI